MATVVKAVYEAGVLKPEEPVQLEERKRYVLSIEPAAEQSRAEDDDPTGRITFQESCHEITQVHGRPPTGLRRRVES